MTDDKTTAGRRLQPGTEAEIYKSRPGDIEQDSRGWWIFVGDATEGELREVQSIIEAAVMSGRLVDGSDTKFDV